MSGAPLEWRPNWRALAVLAAFWILATGLLLHVVCHNGRPETSIPKVQR